VLFNQRVVALVPMKAHSERVPNKNIRPFAGKPLFHHIVGTLDQVCAIDEIIIDTDSDVIAAQAREQSGKVRIIDRPEGLQGDFVSMNAIIAHDIEQVPSDLYLQTHSTNPLLTEMTITKALEAFIRDGGHDSLFTVTPYQSRFYFPDGKAVNHDPKELIRTQDLTPLFEENSCLYLFTAKSFEAAGNRRIGLSPMMFEIQRVEAIDIDDEFTFTLAEVLARYHSDRVQFFSPHLENR
jgi:CMP-N-acetylneuraminic acid synthetase